VFKLTMLSQRKKQELLDSLMFLPGHRAKMIEVFKKIETVSSNVLMKNFRCTQGKMLSRRWKLHASCIKMSAMDNRIIKTVLILPGISHCRGSEAKKDRDLTYHQTV